SFHCGSCTRICSTWSGWQDSSPYQLRRSRLHSRCWLSSRRRIAKRISPPLSGQWRSSAESTARVQFQVLEETSLMPTRCELAAVDEKTLSVLSGENADDPVTVRSPAPITIRGVRETNQPQRRSPLDRLSARLLLAPSAGWYGYVFGAAAVTLTTA